VDDKHLWGREFRMVNEHEYCSKILELTYPARSSVHFHKEKKETFIVLNGVVTIQIGSAMRDYRAGEQVTIEPMTEHSFMLSKKNGGQKALILESSMHHEDDDTYRVRPSVAI